MSNFPTPSAPPCTIRYLLPTSPLEHTLTLINHLHHQNHHQYLHLHHPHHQMKTYILRTVPLEWQTTSLPLLTLRPWTYRNDSSPSEASSSSEGSASDSSYDTESIQSSVAFFDSLEYLESITDTLAGEKPVRQRSTPRRQTKVDQYFTRVHPPSQFRRTPKPPSKLSTPERVRKKIQMTLSGTRAAIDNDDQYGDIFLEKKPKQTLRLLCKNVNGIPTQAFKSKSRFLVKQIGNLEADVIALQETGVNWDLVDTQDTMYERLRNLRHPRSTTAHNTHDTRLDQRQYGGCSLITTNEATARILTSSSDPRGLGRWTSILLSGKKGMKVRFVFGLQPVSQPGNQRSLSTTPPVLPL